MHTYLPKLSVLLLLLLAAGIKAEEESNRLFAESSAEQEDVRVARNLSTTTKEINSEDKDTTITRDDILTNEVGVDNIKDEDKPIIPEDYAAPWVALPGNEDDTSIEDKAEDYESEDAAEDTNGNELDNELYNTNEDAIEEKDEDAIKDTSEDAIEDTNDDESEDATENSPNEDEDEATLSYSTPTASNESMILMDDSADLDEEESQPVEKEMEGEDDSVVEQVRGGSCKCKDKTNKILIMSLQSCTEALEALKTCRKPSKLFRMSKRPLTSCKCSNRLTVALIRSLRGCTQALGTLTSCGGGKKPVRAASSCADLKRRYPKAKSGYYNIRVNRRRVRVYCHMGTLCKTSGGWTRLSYLDTQRSRKCPRALQLYTVGRVRMCGKKARAGKGCASIKIPSKGIKYSMICGHARGYQKGSTDAFAASRRYRKINSPYLDGVSITRGSPRKHVWSLASGHTETFWRHAACPCNYKATKKSYPPRFVGKNYYCESGCPGGTPARRFYAKDPLWDGRGLRKREKRCRRGMMPWFKRAYRRSTRDFIELRVCTDEPAKNENVAINAYAIYIK